jgi:hypothetical protein
MKIRIKGNSVRLRLTRSEIDQFGSEGLIKEETNFPQGKLVYALEKKETGPLSAVIEGAHIRVSMPEQMAREWVSTEKVGYSTRLPLPEGEELFILIEKDFKCLDETIEDQSDNFDNPLAAKN